MDSSIDFYMDVDISYDSTTLDRVVKLVSPIPTQCRNDLYVCLSYMSYVHDSDAYNNAKLSIIEFAQPKSTGTEPDTYAEPVKESAKFMQMQIENAEYDGESICDALNKELRLKLGSQFRSKECQFFWNARLNRVEIGIDGSETVEKKSRATLIIFFPLSHTLGFTDRLERGLSFQFGAPQGKVKPGKITKENHGLASFPPNLPRPRFINWFLDILNEQVSI